MEDASIASPKKPSDLVPPQVNLPWQSLYFCPEPQGHGSLRPTVALAVTGTSSGRSSPSSSITEWKRQLLERAADVFGGADPPKPVDLQPLHAKIGQLTLENDFLERALTKAGLLSAR